MNNKLLVLAGNPNQAREYARRKGLRRDEYMYVFDESNLFGFRKYKMVLVGTWYERKLLDKLLDEVKAQEIEVIHDYY